MRGTLRFIGRIARNAFVQYFALLALFVYLQWRNEHGLGANVRWLTALLRADPEEGPYIWLFPLIGLILFGVLYGAVSLIRWVRRLD